MVLRKDIEPSRHVLSWGAHDDLGQPPGSGQYLARLPVRGPGVENVLAWKMTVLR